MDFRTKRKAIYVFGTYSSGRKKAFAKGLLNKVDRALFLLNWTAFSPAFHSEGWACVKVAFFI